MWQSQNVPDARLRCGTVHSFTHEWSHSFTWQTDHRGLCWNLWGARLGDLRALQVESGGGKWTRITSAQESMNRSTCNLCNFVGI